MSAVSPASSIHLLPPESHCTQAVQYVQTLMARGGESWLLGESGQPASVCDHMCAKQTYASHTASLN